MNELCNLDSGGAAEQVVVKQDQIGRFFGKIETCESDFDGQGAKACGFDNPTIDSQVQRVIIND